MFSSNLLQNQTILVTGGGSGLGLAMATQFSELGARVVIMGRNEEKLATAAKAMNNASYVVADVRDYEAVGQALRKIESDHENFCGLVNNAAGNFYCMSEDLSPNGFQAVVDIVLTGSFNCTQQFGDILIKQKRSGSILNIVTTYTQTGSAFVLPSACAKAGVEAMTKSLAYEWAGFGIRSNAIAPGPFPTKGAWERLMPSRDFEEAYKSRHPMQRFGEPEELARLAAFLMSDAASYINGETVTIDGGMRLEGGNFNFATQLIPRDTLRELFQKMKP